MPRAATLNAQSSDSPPKKAVAIVGIGASAGGLAAIKSLFGSMPSNTGAAFVVVVHLSPDHQSHLAELLQPHCRMPVQQVSEAVALEANRVYIIPPNANLSAIDTHLRLTALEELPRNRATIDHFFRTLAETHDGHSVGIILSGTGSDGTLGIRRIKEAGGVTIAQSPHEAEYDSMPRSAIASGMIDLVLPLSEIPEEVARLANAEYHIAPQIEDTPIADDDNRLLQKIFAQVRTRTGHDFSQYKRATVMRRIARRMQLRNVTSLSDYLRLLRDEPTEAKALHKDMLITVTEFFRDREVFEHLQEKIIPRLFEGKQASDRIRVWSVGCSTGEEAYSIAMLLMEEAEKREEHPAIQVFASDLHDDSISSAREGIYPKEIEADLSPERLKRFFTREGDHYRVRSEVREHVVFAPHDVLSDPPFSRMDLVVCRNLLIYLQRDVQEDVISLFHYALNPEGTLVLGSSETIERSDLFSCEDKAACIYRKRGTTSREPRVPMFSTIGRNRNRRPGHERLPEQHAETHTSYGRLHERVVEHYAPPSVLVDARDELVHMSAHAGRYLLMPGGEITKDIFRLVRPPMSIDLRALIQQARSSKQIVRSKPITVGFNGDSARIVIRASAAHENGHELEGYVLIIFDEHPIPHDLPDGEAGSGAGGGGATQRELEEEVELARQRLQSLHEEHEARREEMQASNEELQSANEELRSTMEELETSKEELQSMNEELATVNQENRHRVEELSQLSDDLANLLAATDIATLFLDRQLRIERFTPQVSQLFNVRHTDRGRPLADITHSLDYPEIQADARTVLDRLTPIEREAEDKEGRWHLVRILPYRSAADRIAGVVITLIDITARKKSEQEIANARHYAEAIVETLHEPLLILHPDLTVKGGNEAFYNHFKVRREETIGRRIYDLGNSQWNIPELRTLLEDVLPESNVFNDYEVTHDFEDLGHRVMLINARRLDHVQLILLGVRDITSRKQHEEQLKRLLRELDHRVKNSLATVLAIARETTHDAASIEEYTKRFEGRLLALAHVHSLVAKSQWNGASLRAIIETATKPYCDDRPDRQNISGPDITVNAQAAVTLAMVFHELCTNAVKYGCFSVEDGLLDVSWSADDSIELIWRETGSMSVDPAPEPGYGTRFIEQSVGYELGGECSCEYLPDGLQCKMHVPSRAIATTSKSSVEVHADAE